MARTRLIPTMFHRRLLLIAALLLLAMLPPAAKMAYLATVRGDELLADAERRLVAERWTPTQRGMILDRKGRILARDRPSFDVEADYRIITGEWAYAQAARRARAIHRYEWRSLSPAEREALIDEHLPLFRSRLDQMWADVSRITGIELDEIEQRKAQIKSQVQAMAASVWERRRIAREQQLARGRGLTAEVTTADVAGPLTEHRSSHVIIRGVDDRVAFALLRMADAAAASDDPMPSVQLVDSGDRAYPFETVDVAIDRSTFPGPLREEAASSVRARGVETHIVGWMRGRVFAEDIARRPRVRPDGTIDRGHYRAGDLVGHTGVEAGREDTLRGLRGLRREMLDTGRVQHIREEHGEDVRLTIDAMLQARLHALLAHETGLTLVHTWHRNETLPERTPLSASAVVLDVESGDILAMASTPSFTRAEVRESATQIYSDPIYMPHLNRAVQRPYAPGSIAKPLILCAAVTSGVASPGERIACTGHLLPDRPDLFRCWIYRQFHMTHTQQFGHDPDPAEALAGSCNIYFYELGRRLGPAGVTRWYERFGVGRDALRPELNVGEQYPGTAGTPPDGSAPTTSDAILMGIGQGPVAWTPLHAADAYATIARAGVRIVPRIDADAPVLREDLGLNRRAVQQALDGLRMAVEDDRGTGHHITFELSDDRRRRELIFNVPNVTIWGKSGTATATPLLADLSGDGSREVVRRGAHAWFVLLVGPEGGAPRYAVSVVVEFGGSGGRVAGPIANQIIHALIEEGYL